MTTSNPTFARVLATALLAVLVAALPAVTRAAPTSARDADLSDLLKRQTQAFSDAGQAGDAKTIDRLLAPDVVFTNETGQRASKQDLVEGAVPSAAAPRIDVTDWTLVRQGDVATATFVDVVTRSIAGQTLVFRFHSTEVWQKRTGGWKMIASQTMVVPTDPPAATLPAALLDDYVGVYEADASLRVTIAKLGEGLGSSTNGGDVVPLFAELRDVLFIAGTAPGRRLFQRDDQGRVTGYISRRNGNDIMMKKVG